MNYVERMMHGGVLEVTCVTISTIAIRPSHTKIISRTAGLLNLCWICIGRYLLLLAHP